MISTLWGPALSGFLLGLGLIIAIGAQNAFLLRQGLLRSHVFTLSLVCALSDAALIIVGIAGLGSLIEKNGFLLQIITIAGAIFLAVYALLAMLRALNPKGLEVAKNQKMSLKTALATVFAFTFLNPHVYLDTVVLVGGLSAQYEGEARLAFGVGAVMASFIWFFSLGYGARWLAPLFARPAAWRILDGLIAVVMASLAASLVMRAIG